MNTKEKSNETKKKPKGGRKEIEKNGGKKEMHFKFRSVVVFFLFFNPAGDPSGRLKAAMRVLPVLCLISRCPVMTGDTGRWMGIKWVVAGSVGTGRVQTAASVETKGAFPFHRLLVTRRSLHMPLAHGSAWHGSGFKAFSPTGGGGGRRVDKIARWGV